MPAFESRDDLLAYLTSTGLGMSMLFSFNSFISAPDYVQHYYRYAANNEHAEPQFKSFWHNAESYISVSNMIPNLLFQLFVFTKVVRRIPMQRKLLVSMTLIIFSMLLIPVMPAFSIDETGAAFTMLFASALAGAATAFFQSTCFALVAAFPAKHMGGMLFGIGLSGTTTCLIQIITKAAMSGGYQDTQNQSRVFFGVAVAWMFISFGSLLALKRNPYAQRFIAEYREEAEAATSAEAGSSSLGTHHGGSKGTEADALITNQHPHPDYIESATEKSAAANENGDNGGVTEFEAHDAVEILPVVKQIWPMMFSCTLTFFITLTVFPGVGVAVNPNDDWFGVIIVFLFNFGDTIGRFGSNLPKIWLPRRLVPIAATCRLIVVPLFIICITPRWIPGNVFPMILMFLTGVSNGFIGSMSLVYGPQTPALKSDGERALAGNSMSLALLGGCSSGSLLALLVTAYLP